MQNEPNLPKAQMNVNIFPTKDYENKSNWTLGENEPKTNPKRTQSKPNKPNLPEAQMSANSILTRDYENQRLRRLPQNKPNSNPISKKPKMNATSVLTRDYENTPVFGLHENKPDQTQFQTPANPPTEPGSNAPAELFDGVYKLSNDQYHSRLNCRFSSMEDIHGSKAVFEDRRNGNGMFSVEFMPRGRNRVKGSEEATEHLDDYLS